MNLAKIVRSNNFLKDTRGANFVEYIILVGIVALVAFAGFKTFGSKVSTEVSNQGTAVGGINATAGGE